MRLRPPIDNGRHNDVAAWIAPNCSIPAATAGSLRTAPGSPLQATVIQRIVYGPLMSELGQNERCHSLRRHGRSTSVSGPAGQAVGASELGHCRLLAARTLARPS